MRCYCTAHIVSFLRGTLPPTFYTESAYAVKVLNEFRCFNTAIDEHHCTDGIAMVAGHTSRFLVIWVAFLPFTLYNTCRWATVPISAIVAFLLLGIEEIGVNIEEPFSILPLGEHTKA